MPTEEFSVTVEVRWVDITGNALMRTLASGRNDRTWNTVRPNLQAATSGVDQDQYETNLVEALPVGPTVGYRWSTESTSVTSNIILPIPLLKKWYGTATNAPIQIEIDSTLLPGLVWDLDSWFGGIGTNEYDFEAAFIHEVGHGLGFVSELESAQSFFYNFISNWDVYRFETEQSPITDIEMLAVARPCLKSV